MEKHEHDLCCLCCIKTNSLKDYNFFSLNTSEWLSLFTSITGQLGNLHKRMYNRVLPSEQKKRVFTVFGNSLHALNNGFRHAAQHPCLIPALCGAFGPTHSVFRFSRQFKKATLSQDSNYQVRWRTAPAAPGSAHGSLWISAACGPHIDSPPTQRSAAALARAEFPALLNLLMNWLENITFCALLCWTTVGFYQCAHLHKNFVWTPRGNAHRGW
jgi:hypothetical protein